MSSGNSCRATASPSTTIPRSSSARRSAIAAYRAGSSIDIGSPASARAAGPRPTSAYPGCPGSANTGRRGRSLPRRSGRDCRAVKLQRRVQRQDRQVAFTQARPHAQRERVVVDRQRGDRRTIVGFRVFDAPAGGVWLPDIPGVVADDTARDPLHTPAAIWLARSSMAANGLPVIGPMR